MARSPSRQVPDLPIPRARQFRMLLLALVAALALPVQALAADPIAGVPAPVLMPVVQTIDVNLYRRNAAMRQLTNYWCVAANTQTMLNLINGTTDRSHATQARFHRQIHRLNRYTYRSPGNDVRGWARFLDSRVGGDWHYGDRSFASRPDAIAAIVESIDRTHHPVGIVVDHGSHAWTVMGYRATVIRNSTVRTIEGLYVSGSLRRDPWPYSFMTLSQFATHFTRYHEPERKVVWEGLFVIVSE